MAIEVETGAGVAGANSYISVSDLDAYATHRLDLTDYTEAQKESALVIASSDWLDGQHTFRSEPLTDTQGLFFPTVDDELPEAIKTATAKAALLQLQGLLLVDLSSLNVAGAVESESSSVGPLSESVTYKSGSAQVYSRVLPKDLTKLLRPFLASAGMGSTQRL